MTTLPDLEDGRLRFIFEYIMNAMGLKPDKIYKFLEDDKLRQTIGDVFESSDGHMVFISVYGAGSFELHTDFPGTIKGKGFYFIKREKGIIDKGVDFATLSNLLYVGDMYKSPITHFHRFINHVMYPMLMNEKNRADWPDTLSEYVLKDLHNLRKTAAIINAKMEGKTYLAHPVSLEKMDEFDVTHCRGDDVIGSLMYSIETTVINWSSQITEVLDQDSGHAISLGKYPLPSEEFKFWKKRLTGMYDIYTQMTEPRAKNMTLLLEKYNSAYAKPYKDIFKKVVRAYVESETINAFLTPLMNNIETVEMTTFEEIKPLIQPLVHIVSLIWVNCEYYRKTERLVVLLIEICNLLIELSRQALDPVEILKEDADEAIVKICTHLDILYHFRKVTDIYRNNVSESCIEQGISPADWGFHPPWVFSRFNSYIERLELIKNFFKTCLDYNRLEKIDVLGLYGGRLSSELAKLYEEFLEEHKKFVEKNMDCLNPTSDAFSVEIERFMKIFNEFDYRLSAVAVRSFESSLNLEGAFKTTFMYGPLLERQIVRKEYARNYDNLLKMLHKEIDNCKVVYDRQMELTEPIIPFGMPPISGSMTWAKTLKERAIQFMNSLLLTDMRSFEPDSLNLLNLKYEELLSLLDTYYSSRLQKFKNDVVQKCQVNLAKNLLSKSLVDETINVTFDMELVEALREIKYLKVLNEESNIPPYALKVYEKNEILRQHRLKLIQIVMNFNYVKTKSKMVEYPLIAGVVAAFESKIEPAIIKLTWEDDITVFLDQNLAVISDLKKRLVLTQDNFETLKELIGTWKESPLYLRKDRKNDNMLNLDDKDNLKTNRYNQIKTAGIKIIQLIADNKELYKIEDSLSPDWLSYIEYAEDNVIDGLLDTVKCSLSYLVRQTEINKIDNPLLLAKLMLIGNDFYYTPTMRETLPESLLDLVDSLIQDIMCQSKQIERIAVHRGAGSFQDHINNCDIVVTLTQDIATAVRNAMKQADEYRVSLQTKYSVFWSEDRKEFIRQFVRFGRLLTKDDFGVSGEIEAAETPPTLEQFKDQIMKYDLTYEEVEKIEDVKIIDSWLKLEIKPFKHALLNVIKLWGNEFKNFLYDHVTNTLVNLESFVKESGTELTIGDSEEVAYKDLVRVLERLKKVRENEDAIDSCFEPTRDTVALLREFGEELPDDVSKLLETLPEQWQELKNQAVLTKQAIQPLQEKEVQNIRHKCIQHDEDSKNLRNRFLKAEVFFISCDRPYDALDEWNRLITETENGVDEVHEAAAIFEVRDIPNYVELKSARRDIRVLKQLWDFVNYFNFYVIAWKESPWKKIDFSQIDEIIREVTLEIRTMDKDVKKWPLYQSLESLLKETNASVQAVRDLQDPAVKERHWKELLQETGKDIKISDETTLSELLSLNLHKFEDEVRGVVSKAANEQKIDKDLEKIRVVWEDLKFEYDTHDRTQIVLPKATDELTQTLEETQVKVLDMIGNRDNAFFIDKINYWHSTLSKTDQVLSLWFEVQRVWSGLESIFVLSEDIKVQLPKDTARFFNIDTEFKTLAKDFEATPKVIHATTDKATLYKEIEVLREDLTLCEKALAQYLETKRLAFPRFYFVSAADLMDIVSNGKIPMKVMKHLSKLFDSIDKLTIVNENAAIKTASHMVAKDGEVMKMSNKINLDGQVEEWLNKLLDQMLLTMRLTLADAVVTYEEKPRDQWIFDYPAQIALTGSQIGWASEVQIAFARLEEGLENAMKDYNKKQVAQLGALIQMLLTDLSANDRQKIMTLCTIDVHNRDVVGKLISQKVDNSQGFLWLSQLRHRWDDTAKDCLVNICDAQFLFAHEYLGNQPRLVITPLTDRCYITLTQSLHLCMSGAPAGPAGTGKTETTKDLGRAMGVMVYVFNCSEQMDYKSIGNIYKGLAQSGSWGCFDEFNRISVEVLSVVAVQVKSIQDAIRMKKERFNFLGEVIPLNAAVGLFITMNPGYAGRTELPENLKALFRPCAMVVPDFELICEIMLVAEGFLDARMLARKFITLYQLCKELLSKQDHYDWGLRAIKSVLVVAGSLKRGDRTMNEDCVLMRALRDFNTPKIVTDDTPVFLGLIGDLFPQLNAPRQRNPKFEADVKSATENLGLQPEDSFVLKVVQLQELFAVRHSVFIVGNAGNGKSQVWKSLHNTYKMQNLKPVAVDLNPKAVTNDELFGIINPSTREWKDGLFSVIMRDLSILTHDGPKWIVLDGDIDPMWIESLNTVMDDNKILTLASNERIPLTKSMRLLFEISNLRTATPATVSRAGILYINPGDLGWQPFVHSWLDERVKSQKVLSRSERSALSICFDKYIPLCLEGLRTKFKKITPIPDISHVQTLCHLLECHLEQEKQLKSTVELTKEGYEMFFVFCCVWAFGGCLFKDQLVDHRVEFSKWWLNEFKQIKFPSSGGVFDFYFNVKTKKFTPWGTKVNKFELDPEKPLQAALVPTVEVARVSYFLDLLIPVGRPVMLIGGAGTGKSVLLQDKFSNLPDRFIIKNVPFNFYTTSDMLQRVLEKSIEKKAGKNYGPPGQSQLIYFIDDLNMPEVDKYFTVQPHTLIRQHIDYSHWYDRTKLTLKIVHKTQYVAAMNPYAGSFTISPRLQRHFAVFALSFPNDEAVKSIYSTILRQHFNLQKISSNLMRFVDPMVELSVLVHNKVAASFLPTAIKFHYIFNLRDLSNIFQGILFTTPECLPNQVQLIRLWKHEAQRVYCDKMVEQVDMDLFKKHIKQSILQLFPEVVESDIVQEPLLYCHFSKGVGDKSYLAVQNFEKIIQILTDTMLTYNETFAAMNLVLFENAICHVLRINRILEMPRGNALLIGIGGSGKQSLSRLASFIAGLDVYQLILRKGFGMNDLKNELAGIYLKTGLKNMPTVFLMTDAQVADEKFLVFINDFLASGEIPDLFQDEEVDQIVTGVRGECKANGIIDTNENCWKFFIDKVRRSLKVILCFSPVGNTIRVRARRFPALVNCTSIDWFHEWPQDALLSVSRKFLEEVSLLTDEVKDSISAYMAFTHTTVNDISQQYFIKDRKYNYTTPKSFLEQIDLFKKLLERRDEEIKLKISRLVNGLERLKDASEQTKDLKVQLAEQEVVVGEKTQATNELIVVVSAETEKVRAEKEIAAGEEAKVAGIKKEVEKKQRECERDLMRAEPALVAAQEALNTLNKNNLSELKALATPPPDVVTVAQAVMVLFASEGKLPRDRSWKNCKATIMSKTDQFLSNLINYNKENIHPTSKAAAMVYVSLPIFQPEIIRSKSVAAAGLCAWVINIIKFHDVYSEVKPKRDALEAANEELRMAAEKLEIIQKRISHLEASLEVLTTQFKAATDEKLRCQEEADYTAKTLDLANRLVNGFASENVRWANQVTELQDLANTVPGDVLITTSFISYFGYFTKPFRTILLEEKLWPFLKDQKVRIPIRDNIDPLEILIDDAIVATWSNENLPTDRMSIENATILSFCERWPLMVDPQLQAIKWIKTKYGEDLIVTRLGQSGYLDEIEKAIKSGLTILLENISEDLDPVLDAVIGRQTIKKGRAIKIGDKEIPYNPNFRLIIQTKLANPHYKPELQAQTTLINFTVTRDGLEDQLLAVVVSKERPDLEKLKSDLTTQQNTFKITLKALEDSLLAKLASSDGNFLGDHSLVENLETNKKTAKEIEEKVIEAKVTEKQINVAREHYRPTASRASLIYFVMNDLYRINPMYQFSLKAFRIVFEQAIDNAIEAETEKERSENLIDSISFSTFVYTTRGLFEKDKLIFTVLIVLQIQLLNKDITPKLVDFLLRYPALPDLKTPVDFLSDLSWGGIHALIKFTQFRDLDKDVIASAKRWKAFIELEAPEKEKFPQEWKNKTSFEKLCMMRALRPDRMTYALSYYIAQTFGAKYVEGRSVEFSKSFQESSQSVPIFFILSPGVDPLKDVELLGKSMGFTSDNLNFHNISLGQGQEVVAEEALEKGALNGHWVVLQNVHLVAKWLPILEKTLEQHAMKANENSRVFISAEPASSAEYHIIPQGILENAIKITNEPPTGMHANLHKALDNFNQDTLERCTKEAEFKPILFALCYFHAVVTERRKFGAQGWNRTYPFNNGDLTICVDVLFNYLEANSKVPWEDLRYLFGEIMYGGHITDDWDRTLCRTYLEEYMQPELVEGDLMLAPGFLVPSNSDYKGYHAYIDEHLPPETPYLYGLHPNAEIEFLTTTSERVFRTVFEMQPRDADAGGGESASKDEILNSLIDELTEKCPEGFNMVELQSKQPPEERTPYTVVVLQECERMNVLINEIKRSLKEFKLGLKGELTITNDMETLGNSLFLDQVPVSWERVAYPSLFTLGLWFADMCIRIKELDGWVQDFALPGSVWLSGLFNPQSFLTAVMQQTARKNDWPLDRMCINCDVTKKQREDMGMAPREGAYVHGLYMEGARWESQSGLMTDAKLKELTPLLPVIFLKAIPVDRVDLRGTYACPVYKTKIRGPTFVWTFNLKTKQKASKWVLGGVSLLLQV